MNCPKCQSENIRVQVITETKFNTKRKSLLYWITIGWLVELVLWLFLTLPKLIYELFKPQRFKVKVTNKKMAVCQNCGHSWRL